MRISNAICKIRTNKKLIFSIVFSILCVLNSYSQSLSHPCIWVTSDEKAAIQNKIESYEWAKSLETQLHTRVDASKNTHKADESEFLSTMPAIGVSGTKDAHIANTSLAKESAVLYYLTGNEDYAQLSADILSYYTEALSEMDGKTITIYNDHWNESRTQFVNLALTYDFIHPFIKKEGGITVYDQTTNRFIPFNQNKAQATMQFMAIKTLNGCAALKSNHSILSGRGALYPILMIEDDSIREAFISHYYLNPDKTRHDAFIWTLNNVGSENIWPESFYYSILPEILLLEEMEVLDRIKPDLNIVNNNLRILEGVFSYENQIYPNQTASMSYGDGWRRLIVEDKIYQRVLRIAKRKGLTLLEEKTGGILKTKYKTNPYKPQLTNPKFDDNELLYLLWDYDVNTYQAKEIEYHTVSKLTHAGISIQRNTYCENQIENGMMGYIGGANYVHSHLQGIDMELYGASYVLGAVGGLNGQRSSEVFTDYTRKYAGHNTVVINGESKGVSGGWQGSSGAFYQNTAILQYSEPLPKEDPISQNFSFTTQYLDDKVNNARQQRTLSLIRTSPTTGYYFDMFRSRSLDKNLFHDYLYHNIGSFVTIEDENNTPLSLTASSRYDNYVEVKGNKFPGWHFFEDVKSSEETARATKIRMTMDWNWANRYTYISIPAGVSREYSSAFGPATVLAEAGFKDDKTPILTIRQKGEAWDRPFIAAFELTKLENPTVKSISELKIGNEIIGAKITSMVDSNTIEDIIISQANSAICNLPSESISFDGQFGIVRKSISNGKTNITLYIGNGNQISYGDTTLKADVDNRGLKKFIQNFNVNAQLQFVSPTSDTTLSADYTNLYIKVNAITGQSNIDKVSLFVDGKLIKEKTNAPYEWGDKEYNESNPLLGLASGIHKFEVVALKNNISIGASSIFITAPIVVIENEPYQENFIIPGIIEAENYDIGGEGISYHDSDTSNLGGVYRNDGVDIEMGGSGYVIGNTIKGEWLEYTVDVSESDDYDLHIYYSSGRQGGGARITVSLPDENRYLLTNKVLPETDGWSDYNDFSFGLVSLEKGKHVLRIEVADRGFNLDKIEFKKEIKVGTEPIFKNSIKVHPNPSSSGQFNLSESQNWEVFTIKGIKIKEGEGKIINLSQNPKGVYLLKTQSESFKLLIE